MSLCGLAAEKHHLIVTFSPIFLFISEVYLKECTYSYGSSKSWVCRFRSSSLSCSWFSLVMKILCKGMVLISGRLMPSPDIGVVRVLARDLGRALPLLFQSPRPRPSRSRSLPPLPRPPSLPPPPRPPSLLPPPPRLPPRPLLGLRAKPGKQRERGTGEITVTAHCDKV